MDFSEAYKCTLLPSYSPDGRYLAAANEYRVIIRDVETLTVVQVYSCLDKIHYIEWSPNSKYVLCGLYDRGAVQAWSVEDPEWACKIDENPAGIKACRWSPDGLSVLLVADFRVRLTVWCLVQRRPIYLPGPKFADRGIAFSPSGDTLAVLERKDCKDWVALYSTSTWELQARKLVGSQAHSMDAADLCWSPNGSCIAVQDSVLTYKVFIMRPDGQSTDVFSADEAGLGVRCMSWSPGGDLLAVGGYDQVARVLNNVTWQPLLECHHGTPVDEPPGVAVYQEIEEQQPRRTPLLPVQRQEQQQQTASASKKQLRARYMVCPLPVDVTSVTPPTNKPNPKLGISSMAWSPDSMLLATVNENMPHAVWVWDVAEATLAAVLLHLSSVRSMAWSPAVAGGSTQQQLAVTTGVGRLYLWTGGGSSIVHIPLGDFNAGSVAWSPDGSSMALMDARGAFCCAYAAQDDC